MAEATGGLVERTCDQCAAFGRCVMIDDCYICEDCLSHHEAALDAATDAIRKAPYPTLELSHQAVRAMVAAAVKVYCEYDPQSGRS